MSAEREPDDEPAAHVPGYCSEHPNQRLVTHRRAGIRWWPFTNPRTDLATVCPGPGHDPYNRDRCLWCGHGLDAELVGRVSPKRAYCRRRGDMCRIDAHRARRRGCTAPPALPTRRNVTNRPDLNAGAGR